MNTKIPILYNYWDGDPEANLINFVNSIQNTNLSNFTIVFICKSNKEDFVNIVENKVFELKPKFDAQFWKMQDDGFFFSGFRLFLQENSFQFFIFLASDALVHDVNWANLLIKPVLEGKTVISGSMASWESIESTKSKIDFLRATSWFRQLTLEESLYLEANEVFLEKTPNKKLKFIIRFKNIFAPNSIVITKLLIFAVEFRYRTINRRYYQKFAAFPNPHLRTTGVATTTEYFMSKVTKLTNSKLEACELESGYHSLSNVNKNQASPIVFSSEGYISIYDLECAKTFRSDTEFLPLVSDGHFRAYRDLALPLRVVLHNLTWS